MLKALKILSIILLLFNGIGALYGGGSFILDPTGGKMQMSDSYLQHSPFSNYLIPGIILFIANGVCSIAAAIITLANWRHYPIAVLLQGCILVGWIAIQIIMVHMVYVLHYIMGATGLALIALGIVQYFLLKKVRTTI